VSITQSVSATCFECQESFDAETGFDRDYCSSECYYTHKGSKAVNNLKHDHRLCANCGRWLKRIDRPTDEWRQVKGSALQVALENGGTLTRENGQQVLDITDVSDTQKVTTDSVCGYEHPTEHAEYVHKEFQIDEYRSTFGTGVGCTCGVTDPRDVDKTLREIELASVLANYVLVFRQFYNEGQIDQEISKQQFFSTFKETRDIEYSLGKALFD